MLQWCCGVLCKRLSTCCSVTCSPSKKVIDNTMLLTCVSYNTDSDTSNKQCHPA